jgi:hypothetical protein
MKRALLVLVACGKPAEPPPKPVVVARDAARAWPVAPAPTLPPDLAISWPTTFDEVRAIEDGEPLAGGLTAYGVTIPSGFPRVFVTNVDLLTLESAWGKLARDDAGYAVWWNPAEHVRARFDVPNPTPSRGRGLELAPYVSTIDRVANLDELAIAGLPAVPPGEWDPGPVVVSITEANPGKRVRFTVRVDGPPVDEQAVLAKLREIYGEPLAIDDRWTYGKGRVVVRHVEQVPAVEITYLSP